MVAQIALRRAMEEGCVQKRRRMKREVFGFRLVDAVSSDQ